MSSKPNNTKSKGKTGNDREPGVGKAPVSVGVFVVTILLAYWAMMELNTRAGGFSRYVYGQEFLDHCQRSSLIHLY